MCNSQSGTLTRRAALAFLPWLCLATITAGCSRVETTSSRAAGTSDRLNRMRALRGTGDPRRPGKRLSTRARRRPRSA
jgi:hypothetical protein